MDKIKAWIQSIKDLFNGDEFEILTTPNSSDVNETISISHPDYTKLIDRIIAHMPESKLTAATHKITVSDSCTSLINELVIKHNKGKTFFLTSSKEHDSVKEAMLKVPDTRKLQLDDFTGQVDFIKSKMDEAGCENLCIIYIATGISDGAAFPQKQFIYLKEELGKRNIPYYLIIDDCRGMFWMPRDYTIFDCILGTAHNIVKGYGMGICVTRKNEKYAGKANYEGLANFIFMADLLLKNRGKVYELHDILKEYLDSILKPGIMTYNIISRRQGQLLFDRKLAASDQDNERLEEGFMKIRTNPNGPNSIILIRCTAYMQYPDRLLTDVRLIYKLFNKNGLLK